MIENIKASLKDAQDAISKLLSNEVALLNIESAAKILIETFENGHRVFSCGNGGSMCDAMHFAEELTGRYRKNRKAYPAIAINDPSHLTCVANDYGYDCVFFRYLEALIKQLAGANLCGVRKSSFSFLTTQSFPGSSDS